VLADPQHTRAHASVKRSGSGIQPNPMPSITSAACPTAIAAIAATAVEQILADARDAEALCAGLDARAAMFIETTLQALDDPAILAELLPDRGAAAAE
jgi:hypothetical protein